MIFKGPNFKFDFSHAANKQYAIMGILNVTKDSFSDGGRYCDKDEALQRALQMESDGADIIDIGAESSRPGSAGVSEEEELDKLLPLLQDLVQKVKVPISIDTTKANVARKCLSLGATIINDISGFKNDPLIADVVKQHDAACVLMHMRGVPATMQSHTNYSDLFVDIIGELAESLRIAQEAGIDKDSIAVDPGIGFSKTTEQSIDIIRNLGRFKELDQPILLGTSRKSLVGNVLNREVSDRLSGSLATLATGFDNGARIFRVHDVKESSDFLRMHVTLK